MRMSRQRLGRFARAVVAATLGVLVMSGVSGCGGSDPTDPQVTTTHRGTLNAIEDPEQVPVLARQRLGEQVVVRRVSLTDTGFQMEVRDPVKPQNLDRYSFYSGDWTTGPVSMSMRDIEELEQTTFGIGSVNWEAIPGLQRRALEGLDLSDATINSVSVDRIAGQQPRIFINVSGPRGSGSLLASADGTKVEIRRH